MSADAGRVPSCQHAGCDAEARHRARGLIEGIEVEFGLCDEHYAPIRPDLRGISIGFGDETTPARESS